MVLGAERIGLVAAVPAAFVVAICTAGADESAGMLFDVVVKVFRDSKGCVAGAVMVRIVAGNIE